MKHATVFADPGGCEGKDKKRAPMEARDCVCRSGVVVKAKTKSVRP